ncbi:MAG: ABC transporter permease subunit [Acidobacteriota bacterium]
MKGHFKFFWVLLASILLLAGLSQTVFHAIPGSAGPRSPASLSSLPLDTLYSLLRMTAAYLISLLFSLPYGYYAAAKPKVGRILLPLLDILQSIPVLGFFPAAVFFFVALTGGGRFGVEMSCVFLIFTGQAWNMAFGVYESCSTVPRDLTELGHSYGLSRSQLYRRVYLPASVPKLVYNSMMSWAGGWYFLIACEIIAVGPVHYDLPGLGSFLIRTTEQGRIADTFIGLGALVLIIVAMDVAVWRPLTGWSARFRYELAASSLVRKEGRRRHERQRGRVNRRIRLFYGRVFRRRLKHAQNQFWERIVRVRLRSERVARAGRWGWTVLGWATSFLFVLLMGYALYKVALALAQPWPAEARRIPLAMLYSTLRMIVAYVLALSWTIPIAVWAGSSKRIMQIVRPAAQIGASIPATALFPIIVILVINLFGGMNLASVILILTGMQWYLLFNLLSGVESIPQELKEASQSLGLTRWQRFRRLTLPAILPSLITGSITGWGGGWNALIVSEYLNFSHKTYWVPGIGAMLDRATYDLGNITLMVLSLSTMVLVIVLLNHFFWRRLYNLAAERFRLDL